MNIFNEYMVLINDKITSGSEYCWNCYGTTAYEYSHEQDEGSRYSISIVFDTHDRTVYELTALDYENEVQFRWINPAFKNALKAECKSRNFDFYTAFDDAFYTDISSVVEFLSAAIDIINRKEDKTTVLVSLDIPDDVLRFLIAQAATEDITLNQYIETILIENLQD